MKWVECDTLCTSFVATAQSPWHRTVVVTLVPIHWGRVVSPGSNYCDAFVLNKQTVSSRPSQNNLQRRTEYDCTPWKMPSAGPEALRSPLGCRVDYIRGSKVCHGGVMGVEVLS